VNDRLLECLGGCHRCLSLTSSLPKTV
jgi:hypothetical protein